MRSSLWRNSDIICVFGPCLSRKSDCVLVVLQTSSACSLRPWAWLRPQPLWPCLRPPRPRVWPRPPPSQSPSTSSPAQPGSSPPRQPRRHPPLPQPAASGCGRRPLTPTTVSCRTPHCSLLPATATPLRPPPPPHSPELRWAVAAEPLCKSAKSSNRLAMTMAAAAASAEPATTNSRSSSAAEVRAGSARSFRCSGGSPAEDSSRFPVQIR